MNTSSMRGLNVFISDLRACRSREQEEKRINKELGNIRSKFKEGNLSGYHKKKYICKLLYIYLLGYEVDFGHIEAVNLISSNKYSEKQIGYLAVTLLLTETSELIRLVINSMKKDLEDLHELNNCLALQAIANLGGREIAESLSQEVFKILASPDSVNFPKKKAALCLLRLYRKNPESIPFNEWGPKILTVLEDYDLGVNLSVYSLVYTLAQQSPESFAAGIPRAIQRLYKIVIDKEYTPDNVYYSVPVPWLQVKIMRYLQLYPIPSDPSLKEKLNQIIQTTINLANEIPKNVQQNNAINAVLLEGINLAIMMDSDSPLITLATNVLVRYISSKETNMRYLGLEALTQLTNYPAPFEIIKKNQDLIMFNLKDKDISVRRRALDLLYCMCDSSNAKTIVEELLQYLTVADYAIRDEMVLKIAILTEKFTKEFSWYIDVILKLITIAGDHVSNEVWYRVVQIVTNNPNLHVYASKQIINMLMNPSCHENGVKVGAYILGEFGDLIANEEGSNPIQQFRMLHSKFGLCSSSTKAILLTTYIKFVNLFPEIKNEIVNIFKSLKGSLDTELQQRACEYYVLATMPNDELLQAVFEQMPPFPEKESAIIQKLKKQITETGADTKKMMPGF